MTFPDFCRLSAEYTDVNATLLNSAGFVDGQSSAQALNRIIALWNQSPHRHSHDPALRRDTTAGRDNTVSRDTVLGQDSVLGPSGQERGPAWYHGLERVLPGAPLPDVVVSVVEQFVRNSLAIFDPFGLFAEMPRSLDILARTACSSPFLTQSLLADPESLPLLLKSGRTAEMKAREQFAAEAEDAIQKYTSRLPRLTGLRHYQRRELLRIGMCDAFGLLDLRYVTLQLSLLADAMVQVCLNLAAEESGEPASSLTVIALGKHGGEELNYSSDIDLILISERDSSEIQRLARLTIDGLADNLPPGFLYRVDLRLRPWGDAGALACTPETYAQYLRQDAALWERQALLKARTIAGDVSLGRRFLQMIRPLLFRDSRSDVRSGIQQMKEKIEVRLKQRGRQSAEVKLGAGTIRDVEFLVQYLQLTHGKQEPRVLSCNTLDALVRLAEFGLLSPPWYRQLRAGYVFLRTVEHSVQLLHNQQTHELPSDPRQLAWLAHRLDYPDAATLLKRFAEHRQAVRAIFDVCLETKEGKASAAANAPLTPDSDGGRTAEFPTSASDQLPITEKRDHVIWQEQILIETMSRAAAEHDLISVDCQASAISGLLQLILVGAEFPAWLSKICGVLAISRMDIRSGDAVCGGIRNRYGHLCPEGQFLAVFLVRSENAGCGARLSGESAEQSSSYSGTGEVSCLALAESLQRELTRTAREMRLVETDIMRTELLNRFCDVVQQIAPARESLKLPVVEVRSDTESGLTLLEISGTDTFGFLFELAHALSLSRYAVVRAIVDSDGDQVRDVLSVTETDGGPVDLPDRIQELRVAVALIMHFTHWLPSTSSPRKSLQRFRDLVNRLRVTAASDSESPETHGGNRAGDIQSLQRPDVLRAVSRMLGIGQYLWEEFLRSGHEDLFPLLANTDELATRISRMDLSVQLDELISAAEARSAGGHGAAWNVLNLFKDRHLFRIDMRHVMGHCRPFGAFSEEITELAEVVVCRAVLLARDELIRSHGVPRSDADQSECCYAVAGLGKFGGIEMGYASDIELILLYSASGFTDGPDRISSARFFDALVATVASGISARPDGIFQVDLRMRPFGQAGAAAVLLQDFEAYYRVTGPAWPYERQAMTKFRCVAGDPIFSARAQVCCHQAIYSAGMFDFASMKAMRERQIRQLVRGGTIDRRSA